MDIIIEKNVYLAFDLIGAGAKAIIGHHPHCVGGLVFYQRVDHIFLDDRNYRQEKLNKINNSFVKLRQYGIKVLEIFGVRS